MKINPMMNQCLKMILAGAMTAQITLPSQARAAVSATAAQCAAVNAGTVDTPSVVASCTGITATDPQLSQNTWIAQLQPNGPSANGQTYAQLIQTAPTPALILSGYTKMLREQIMFVPGDVNTTSPANQQTAQNLASNQRYYSIIIAAQQLLNSTITNGPSLAAALKASNYTLAWSLAKQYGLISFLVNPIGFRLLGIAPFTQAQMSAFYTAATPYWSASVLGPDPYSPNVEWGTVDNLAQDAITNFNTLGDATYPDLGRFAGQRPPGSLFNKWIEPIVIMAVVAVITAGVGAAIADGVNAAIGATTDVTAAAVGDSGAIATVSTTTSALGTLGTTTTVVGADLSVTTTMTSTLLGSALSAGESTAAGALMTVAQGSALNGKSLVEGSILGALGSSALNSSGINSALSSASNTAVTNIADGVLTGAGTSFIMNGNVTTSSVMSGAVNASVGIASSNMFGSSSGVDLSSDSTPVDTTDANVNLVPKTLTWAEQQAEYGSTLAANGASPETVAALTGTAQAGASTSAGVELIKIPVMSPDAAVNLVQANGDQVATFIGFSGKGYQDPTELQNLINGILDTLNPATTVINAGVTPDGIGMVYELAQAKGFTTTGIVSTAAFKYGGQVYNVDVPVAVQDTTWGGFVKDSTTVLNPTSQAMVDSSNVVYTIGGGQVGADETLAALAKGLPVYFYPALNGKGAVGEAAGVLTNTPSDMIAALGSSTEAEMNAADAALSLMLKTTAGSTAAPATVTEVSSATSASTSIPLIPGVPSLISDTAVGVVALPFANGFANTVADRLQASAPQTYSAVDNGIKATTGEILNTNSATWQNLSASLTGDPLAVNAAVQNMTNTVSQAYQGSGLQSAIGAVSQAYNGSVFQAGVNYASNQLNNFGSWLGNSFGGHVGSGGKRF